MCEQEINIDSNQELSDQQNQSLSQIAKAIFKTIDNDQNEVIDEEELMIAISQIADNLQIDTPQIQEVQEILKEFDENNDGVLQYEEFEKLILELFSDSQSDDIDDDIENKQRRQRAKGSFISQVQERRLSLDSKKFLKLFEISIKQSQVSSQLAENQEEISKEVKQTIGYQKYLKGLNDNCKNTEIRDTKKSYQQYVETKKSDSKYLNESLILKAGPIKSVYTSMNPEKTMPDFDQDDEQQQIVDKSVMSQNNQQLKPIPLEKQFVPNRQQKKNQTTVNRDKKHTQTQNKSNGNTPVNHYKKNRKNIGFGTAIVQSEDKMKQGRDKKNP